MLRLARILNRKTVLIFVVIIVALITTIVIKYWDWALANLGIISYIFTGFIILAALCVKYPNVYMYWVYLKAILFGVETLLNLSTRYIGTISQLEFKQLCNELEKMSERVSVHIQNDGFYKATLDGINFTLSISDQPVDDLDSELDYEQSLHCQVVDFRAPYEDTIKLLENTIIPYLLKIDHIIKAKKTDYELNIIFLGGNPWTKAVTKGFNFNSLVHMDCTFEVEYDRKLTGQISLGKRDMRITCTEIGALTRLVHRKLMPIS